MIVHTPAGEDVRLGRELARGGEAVVYEVDGRAELLAKIYVRLRPEHRDKLRHMRASPPDDPTRAIGHASIAWPRDLLLDSRGHFVGYAMPYVRDAVPLLDVISPRRRGRLAPGFNRAYLHRAGRNLSSALGALHARDYVIGDLNERNILVTPRALITLIDVDSFQVQEPRAGQIVVYPCPVGRSEYTPPELQERAFHGVMRKSEHDRFGLAVLLFQLLMEGNHPFRGRWLGSSEPPTVEEKIARGWFVFGAAAPAELTPPPAAPALETLHPQLQALFVRCFGDGHDRPHLRPSAGDWASALAEAEDHLVACGNRHLHADHLARCPYCGARRGRLVRVDKPRPAATSPAAGAVSGPRAPVSAAARPRRPSLRPAWWRAQVGRRTLAGVARPLRAARSGVVAVPRQLALVVLAGLLRPQSTASAIRRARAMIAWQSRMALAAAAAGTAVGASIALALSGLAPGLAQAPPTGLQLPAGAWAGAVGMLAMAVVASFHGLIDVPPYVRGGRLVRSSAARPLAAVAGWLGGWLAVAAATALLRGEAMAALAGSTPIPPWLAAAPLAVGWTLGWSVYGGVAGALGGALRQDAVGWTVSGAVFGAAGAVGARLLVELLAALG